MDVSHDYDYCRRYRIESEEILYRVRLIEVNGVWRVEAHRLDTSARNVVTGEVDAWEFGSEDAARDFVNAFLDEKHGVPGEEID